MTKKIPRKKLPWRIRVKDEKGFRGQDAQGVEIDDSVPRTPPINVTLEEEDFEPRLAAKLANVLRQREFGVPTTPPEKLILPPNITPEEKLAAHALRARGVPWKRLPDEMKARGFRERTPSAYRDWFSPRKKKRV